MEDHVATSRREKRASPRNLLVKRLRNSDREAGEDRPALLGWSHSLTTGNKAVVHRISVKSQVMTGIDGGADDQRAAGGEA